MFAGKQRTAARSLDAAATAVQNKDHGHALGVLVLIDPNLLPADGKTRRQELIDNCKAAAREDRRRGRGRSDAGRVADHPAGG